MAGVERPSTRRTPVDSRHRGREAAVQMLYQAEVGRMPIAAVVKAFWDESPAAGAPDRVPRGFAEALAIGVTERAAELDPLIADATEHWRIERMNVMDRLILRLAVYEFEYETDTPAKVIINEALELARTFSADDSVRFINGILDAVRRTRERQ